MLTLFSLKLASIYSLVSHFIADELMIDGSSFSSRSLSLSLHHLHLPLHHLHPLMMIDAAAAAAAVGMDVKREYAARV